MTLETSHAIRPTTFNPCPPLSRIGVFDSGVGGLSVLRHLRALLPDRDVLYAADEAWCPYGPKPADLVRERAIAVADALIEQGAGLIVVACNTASTVALADLRVRWPELPFVGMEPAVKPAAATTASGAVGVLATATTAHGESLARLVDRFGKGVDVHVAVPEGLVELIERGEGDGPGAEAILRPILERWRAAAVDVVVLGCTHYPFVRAAIERIAGPAVAVIDPAPAVARQAARVLATVSLGPSPSGLASVPGQTHLLTTGDPASLRAAVARLLSAPWTRTASYTHLEA